MRQRPGLISAGGAINQSCGLAQGLVGFWMATPQTAGGGILTDLTNYNRHGTLTNGPTWVGSPYGPALSVSGGSYIDSQSAYTFPENLPFSVSMIAMSANTSQSGVGALVIGSTGAGSLRIVQDASNYRAVVRNVAAEAGSASLSGVSTTTYQSITAVFGSDLTVSIYINENKASSTFTTPSISTTNIYCGVLRPGVNPWAGRVLGYRVLSRAISDSEVVAILQDWQKNFPTLLNRRRTFVSFAGSGAAAGRASLLKGQLLRGGSLIGGRLVRP